jgi:hypothetical protein
METKKPFAWHPPDTADSEKQLVSREAAPRRRLVMQIIEKATLRYLLVAAVALGCSASVLSGTLTMMSVAAG